MDINLKPKEADISNLICRVYPQLYHEFRIILLENDSYIYASRCWMQPFIIAHGLGRVGIPIPALVDVIIPVKNGAAYIRKILDRLNEQTFRDFDVIIVADDASADDTVELSQTYDSERVRTVVKSLPGPMGTSRNIGLSESTAELIWFLDVDDRPLPTFLEKMVGIQQNYDADIVACNFLYASDLDSLKIPKGGKYTVKVMDSATAMYDRSMERFPVTCWSKLFKRNLLVDNNIYFSDGYCEDIYHTFNTISHSKVICYYDEPLYAYFQHYNSFCNNNEKSDLRGESEIRAYGDITKRFGDSVIEGNFRKRLALVTIRSSGHMSYKKFKKYAKSEGCKDMLRRDCRGVPEALWYRLSPSTYYLALRMFFKVYYYHSGRIYTTPGTSIGREYVPYTPSETSGEKIPITIGICAYNEERNIERTIRSIFRQHDTVYSLEDVLVVSSGSTDGTNDIVRSLSDEFPQVKLIVQEKREGKNSAINLLFENKKTEVMVFLNADNILESVESLNKLIEPFRDKDVGMVGGRPIPTNRPYGFAGYTVQLMWYMHHLVALQKPKTGELIAFRDLGTRLPTDMQSDEDILRMKLEEQGYKTVYAPEATILNRGPETVGDYIKQRTRVNIGEGYLKKKFGYGLPTHDYRLLMNAFIGAIKEGGFHPFRMIGSVLLEIYPRIKARIYVMFNKGDVSIWEQVTTTKKL